MTVFTRLLSTTALLGLAPQAFAAVTPEDVWASQITLYEATGAEVSATLARNGASLAVSDIRINYVLPFSLGNVAVDMGGMTLIDNGDGSVTLDYATDSQLSIDGSITIEGDTLTFGATLDLGLTDFTGMATGDPADVTLEQSAGMTEITLVSLYADEVPELDDIDITMYVAVSDSQSTTRLQDGDMLTVTSSGTAGQTVTDFSISIPDIGMVTQSVNAFSGTASEVSLTIPGTPINIMDLSQALRDGLSLSVSNTTTGAQAQNVTMMDGALMSDQSQSTGMSTQTLSMDQTGLKLGGEASDASVNLSQPEMIAFPISIAIADVGFNMGLPVNQGDQPQDMALGVSLAGLTVNDEIWDLFDAGNTLPRDPATISYAFDGSVLLKTDLMDFETLIPMLEDEQIPFELQRLTLSNILLAAVGAQFSGFGDFTFDNSDLVTFGGLPRPQGEATFELTGANALMDKLAAMGLIPAEELAMPRMMMGMFAQAVGDDQYRSTVVIDAQGGITANGVPLQ